MKAALTCLAIYLGLAAYFHHALWLSLIIPLR
jgi:hypothetical protein